MTGKKWTRGRFRGKRKCVLNRVQIIQRGIYGKLLPKEFSIPKKKLILSAVHSSWLSTTELCIADQVRRTHLCALMFSDRASKASLTTSSLMSCKERHSHDSNTVNVCKGQSQNRFESVLCEGSSLDAALATKQSPEGGETK